MMRLHALETYVHDVKRSQAFWATHFGLEASSTSPVTYQIGAIVWRLLPGAHPCGTHGPHGVLPVFQIDDFGQARGYLFHQNIPVVFDGMSPGQSLLVFLDPDGTPVELAQITDPSVWDIQDRLLLRTRRRQDQASDASIRLGPVSELIIYTYDVTASVRFYRDLLQLPVGAAFFGHVHLLTANLPIVLRTSHWRCKGPGQPHATSPVFAVSDLPALAQRLADAGYVGRWTKAGRLSVTDPVGVRLHFEAEPAA